MISPIFQINLKLKNIKSDQSRSKYTQAPKEQFQSTLTRSKSKLKQNASEKNSDFVVECIEREQKGRAARRHPPPRGGWGCSPERRGPSQRRVAMFYEVANRCQLCLVILDFTGRSRRCINSLTNKILIVGRDNRVGQPR